MSAIAAREPTPSAAVPSCGTAVPFTTPSLAQSRLRAGDRGLLELVVPALGGTKGTYVVPFKDLPLLMTMTVHDRTLHEEMMKRKASSPDDVRVSALTVAKTGLAGPRAAKAARKALEEEADERLLTTVFLVSLAIHHSTGGESKITIQELIAEGGRARAKALLAAVAQKGNIGVDAVYAALEDWGTVVGAIGVPKMPKECRLRRLARHLAALPGELARWAEYDQTAIGDCARDVGKVAKQTAQAARAAMAALDGHTSKFGMVLTNWKSMRATVKDRADSLSWTLDGWEPNVLRWRDSLAGSRDQQETAVLDIYQGLPQAAQAAAAAGQRADDKAATGGGRRWVRSCENWRTGELDLDLMRRLEALKEKSL